MRNASRVNREEAAQHMRGTEQRSRQDRYQAVHDAHFHATERSPIIGVRGCEQKALRFGADDPAVPLAASQFTRCMCPATMTPFRTV